MDYEDLFSILGVIFPNRVRAILSDGLLEGISGGYTIGTLQQIGSAIKAHCPVHSDFEGSAFTIGDVVSLTRVATLQNRPDIVVRYVHLPHQAKLPCQLVALACGPSDAIDELKAPSTDPFPLTDQEMNLALALAAGRSLQEMADWKDCSIHTVRNQLKSALRSTGVHSQSQLISLLRDWLV